MPEAFILKSTFNAAVQAAIPTVQTPLLATEAAVATLGLDPTHPVVTNLAATHAALAALLVQADEMGETGGVHTDTGGGIKGDD